MPAIYISFLPELSLFIIISVRVSRAALQGNYPNSRLHANLFASYFLLLGNNELMEIFVALAKGTLFTRMVYLGLFVFCVKIIIQMPELFLTSDICYLVKICGLTF